MKKRIVILSGALLLLMLSGCSRTVQANRTKENLPGTVISEISTAVEEKTSADIEQSGTSGSDSESSSANDESMPEGIKLFGDTILTDTNKYEGNLKIYKSGNKDQYYYDGDGILRLIICDGNAEVSGSCTQQEIEEKTYELLEKISDVCRNKDVELKVSYDGYGHECRCVQTGEKEIVLAVLNYDAAGNLVSANLNLDAYGKKTNNTFSRNDYINAAKTALQAEYGERFEEFLSHDPEIEIVEVVIRGDLYNDVRMSYTDGVGIVWGYSATVSQDDLNVKYTDMLK